jgi:DNA-binding PadR family transcriptional regulator
VGTGTLCAAIERLAEADMIELAGEEVVDGRNRRRYRITGSGKEAVTVETGQRAEAIGRAQRQLGLARPALTATTEPNTTLVSP